MNSLSCSSIKLGGAKTPVLISHTEADLSRKLSQRRVFNGRDLSAHPGSLPYLPTASTSEIAETVRYTQCLCYSVNLGV